MISNREKIDLMLRLVDLEMQMLEFDERISKLEKKSKRSKK